MRLVSRKYHDQGDLSLPQTMVAPYLGRKPASRTRSYAPSSSSTGMLAGSSDSPTWARGNRSRSSSSTRKPLRASIVAAVLPPGPPPTTTTSAGGLDGSLRPSKAPPEVRCSPVH